MKKLFPLLVCALLALVPLRAHAATAETLDDFEDAHMEPLVQSFLHLEEATLKAYGIPTKLDEQLKDNVLTRETKRKARVKESKKAIFTPEERELLDKAVRDKLSSLKVYSTKLITKNGDDAQVMITVDQVDYGVLEAMEPKQLVAKFIETVGLEPFEKPAKTKEEKNKRAVELIALVIKNLPTHKTAIVIDCKYDESTASYVPVQPKQMFARLVVTGVGI